MREVKGQMWKRLLLLSIILIFSLQARAEDRQGLNLNERMIRLETKVDGLDKRIDEGFKAVNQRIDGLDKRIDDLRNIMLGGFGVIFAGIFTLIGFVLWDRRTALVPAVRKAKELEEEEEKIKRALREYAIQEPKLATVLKQVGLL
ncbi:MAG: hypothetical protein QME40_01770 [bacterium]|nr:hypothetical protein [bacterium]